MTFTKQKPVFINNLLDELLGNLAATDECNSFTNPVNVGVNIHESNDGFHLELNAPARQKEDFKINTEKGILSISYEKKEDVATTNYKTLRREFSVKSFKRNFNLDNNINVDDIKAKYENGVLSVFLPKKEEIKTQPKEINIL